MQTADGIDSLGTLKGNQETILCVTAAKLGYGTDYIVYVRTVSHKRQYTFSTITLPVPVLSGIVLKKLRHYQSSALLSLVVTPAGLIWKIKNGILILESTITKSSK
jgi:hypothetical protein